MDRRTPAATGGYWLAVAIVAVAGIGLRLALYDPWGQYHADELYQYLEQGNRLAEGYGLQPWETWHGIRNGLIPQFLSVPLWLGDLFAPTGMLPIHLARLSFMALCLAALVGAWGIGVARSRRHALAALLVGAVWYDSVFFSTTLLSESLATAALACGAALLLVQRAKTRTLRLAGFLIVLGVLVRVQYAPFVAALVILGAGREGRTWRQLSLGGGAALLLGALSDLVGGQVPFAWVFATVSANIGGGIAARYGTEGPLFYIDSLRAALGPAAVLIVALSALAGRRYWPLLAATWLNVVVHSLIAHKEPRFIWLSLFLTLVLAAIGSVNLVERVLEHRSQNDARRHWLALALLCAGWAGLAAHAARTGPERLARRGAVYPLAAHEVARHREICGLAVPENFAIFVASVHLRRDVPIYYIPVENLGGLSPLPEELRRGANAALNEGDLLSDPDYEVVTCKQRDGDELCLLVRPGPCEPAVGKPYSLQEQMRRED